MTAWKIQSKNPFDMKITTNEIFKKPVTISLLAQFDNWNMKNGFSILNLLIKLVIENWKKKSFFNFQFWSKNWNAQKCPFPFQFYNENWMALSVHRLDYVPFYFILTMKIEWHFPCTDFNHLNLVFILR